MANKEVKEITKLGDPSKPKGLEGSKMLQRMNESHYEVTGWALSHWSINGEDNILDIGCGGGMTLFRMAKEIDNGHLTGLDYSKVSVEESTKLNEGNIKNGKMNIIEGNVESLPFNDNSFDKIITVESFYFWPNHVENLKEVHRVLNNDGTFMLVADIYNKEGLSQEILDNIKLFKLFNPTKEEFFELFQNAGFKDVKIYTTDTWITVLGSK